ncbi:MAG TPA: hypothetical protein VFN79_08960 [Steroidobacteraceae bacterium]|nr:hypothetical protein [Steroidobacteraceae bacterium]
MTRTSMIAAAILLCAGAWPVAHADCGPAPRAAFAIPDGAHASRDEMSAAKDNLSEYSARVAAYASCLDAAQADAGRAAGNGAQDLRGRYLDLGSAALTRLAAVVNCFTQQVRAFRTTGGGRDAGPARCSRTGRQRPSAAHARRGWAE